MKLTIIANTKKPEGSAWQWYREKALAGISYEITQPGSPIKGERVLLMGQKPLNMYVHPELSIFKSRGQLYTVAGKPTISTFDLEDAWAFKSDDPEKEDTFGKDRAKTQKTNWLFWIEADTAKLLGTLGAPQKAAYQAYPNISLLTEKLHKFKGIIYLDIETDMGSDTLDCIGIMLDKPPVYVVPIYRYTGKLAYGQRQVLRFMAALSHALLHNRAVIHNAMFDLLYLASHYRLPFGADIFDTMLAHKRCLPEIEKSLGHAISYWTWQHYHKDEHCLNASKQSEEQLWEYNAKDVFSMSLVYHAIQARMASNKGLADSINQANASVYPYILASLKGVAIDMTRLAAKQREMDARIVQIRRVIKTLIGSSTFNPDSPKQLVDFFHNKLNYKVQETTKTGQPSLGGKALYELALSYPNPVIPSILHYREITKERSMMNFGNHIFPWETL